MRWSEFAMKECIDLAVGERMGNFSTADLQIDPATGRIQSIQIPVARSWFSRKQDWIELQWQMIKTVGSEMIIIDSKGKSF
jgi:YlmC/YmxH family sporulation protein